MADRARPIHHLLALVRTWAAFRRLPRRRRIHVRVLIEDARAVLPDNHRRDRIVWADLRSNYRAIRLRADIDLKRPLDAAAPRISRDSDAGGICRGRRDDVRRQRRSDATADSGSVRHEALWSADGDLWHFRYARLCRRS